VFYFIKTKIFCESNFLLAKKKEAKVEKSTKPTSVTSKPLRKRAMSFSVLLVDYLAIVFLFVSSCLRKPLP